MRRFLDQNVAHLRGLEVHAEVLPEGATRGFLEAEEVGVSGAYVSIHIHPYTSIYIHIHP